MDNKPKSGSGDSDLINAGEAYEMEYWSKKFGVSIEQLKSAIKAVGNSASTIGKYLKIKV